jgi:hypothetical protein
MFSGRRHGLLAGYVSLQYATVCFRTKIISIDTKNTKNKKDNAFLMASEK